MEEQERVKIVVLNEEVLGDKNLSPAEKLVYARISYFEEFFESSEATAEYLGLKKWTVQQAKRKLEEYGYIQCVRNTGRGKRYVADVNTGVVSRRNNKTRVCSDKSQSLVRAKSEFGENKVRVCENQYIDKNIKKNIGKKENSITKVISENAVSEQQDGEIQVFGNDLVNRAFELWKEVMGYEHPQPSQKDRNAAWNIMRAKSKGEDWLKQRLVLAREAAKDLYSGKDCQITCLDDFYKWGGAKLKALEQWGMRQNLNRNVAPLEQAYEEYAQMSREDLERELEVQQRAASGLMGLGQAIEEEGKKRVKVLNQILARA